MSAFDEEGFEKKLTNLKDTQESVSQLSHWCLVNKQHHKKIVALWLSVLKKAKVESRLTLFHLANDVIQYSKRKNLEFVESWGTALQRATPMVRDEKVQKKILRIFKIWGERSIYEETFLTDLCGLLTTTTKRSSVQAESHSKSHHHDKPAPVTIPLVFEPQNLFLKIRDCVKLENDTDFKMKYVNECPLALNDVDSLRASLKDRRHGDEAVADVDDAIERMKAYEEALKVEVHERRTLIELLRHGETFYENERGEAKVVFNAYRNFGSRVKSVKRKLDELIPTLSSPIPSPDVNAPSPSPDSDIDLPNDEDLTGIVECLQNSSSSDDEADPDLPKYKLKHLSARHRRRGLPLPIPGDVTLRNIDGDDSKTDIDHYLYELALCESQSNSENGSDDEDFRLWFSSDEEESPKTKESVMDPMPPPGISDRDPRLKKFLRPDPSVERTIPDSSSGLERSSPVDSGDFRLDEADTGVGLEEAELGREPVTSSQENDFGLKSEPTPRTPSPASITLSPYPRTPSPKPGTSDPKVETPDPEVVPPDPEVVPPDPEVVTPDPEMRTSNHEQETSSHVVQTPNSDVELPNREEGIVSLDQGTTILNMTSLNHEVRPPGPEVRLPDSEVRVFNLDVETPDPEVRKRDCEVQSRDPVEGRPNLDVGTRGSEVGIPDSDVGSPKLVIHCSPPRITSPEIWTPFAQSGTSPEIRSHSPNSGLLPPNPGPRSPTSRTSSQVPQTLSPSRRTPSPSCRMSCLPRTPSPLPRTPSPNTFNELLCSTPVQVNSLRVLETSPEESLSRRTSTSDDGLKPDDLLSESELLILRNNILNELETESAPMDISEEDLPGEGDISSVLECIDMDVTP